MVTALRTPTFLTRLGLGTDADERAIRRAYAREVKLIDAELQPAEFQTLREAYEHATAWLKWRPVRPSHVDEPGETEEDAKQGLSLEYAQGSAPAGRPAALQPDLLLPPQAPATSAAEAASICSAFTARLLRGPAPSLDEQRCAEALTEQLADSRLIGLDARMAFEQTLAEHLAAGWKPGNDVLFAAAIKTFQWNTGRSGLHHFGTAGFRLNRAVTEWEIVLRRAGQGSKRDMELLLRLRDDTPPSSKEALYFNGMLAQMLRQFPNLLPTMTNLANKAAWLAPLTFSATQAPVSAAPGGGSYAPPSPYINAPNPLSAREVSQKTPEQKRPLTRPVDVLFIALLLLGGFFYEMFTGSHQAVQQRNKPAVSEQHFKPVNLPILLPMPGDHGFHPLLQSNDAAAMTARIRPNVMFDKNKMLVRNHSAEVRYLIAVDANGLPTATVLETSSGSPEFDAAIGHAIAASGPYPDTLISSSVPVIYAISPNTLDAPPHAH